MRVPLRTCFGIAILLLATSFSVAQRSQSGGGFNQSVPKTASISGQLRLPSGFSGQVMGIQIVLENGSGAEVARTTTDSKGKFEFPSVPSASYTVKLQQLGYEEREERIELSYMPAARVYLDLVQSKQESRPGPVSSDTVDASLAGVPPAAVEAFKLGKDRLLVKKDAAASIDDFKKAEAIAPKFVNAYMFHGLALEELRKPAEAAAVLRIAVKLDPEKFGTNFLMGISLNEAHKYSESEGFLRKAVSVNAGDSKAQYELSRSLLSQGKWQEAEAPAQTAHTLDPKLAPANVILGNISLRKRDARAALEYFKNYLAIEPHGPFSEASQEMVRKIQAALNQAH